MRISDWSSDVCSSDLALEHLPHRGEPVAIEAGAVPDPYDAHLRASRPVPGFPAKHWAMPSHVSASVPTATRSVSARLMRWVTSRQKSWAEPVTRCAASTGP